MLIRYLNRREVAKVTHSTIRACFFFLAVAANLLARILYLFPSENFDSDKTGNTNVDVKILLYNIECLCIYIVDTRSYLRVIEKHTEI